MTARNRILVKKAEMLALHNRYVKAMEAGRREIQKIASAEMARQATYRKVLSGLTTLAKIAQVRTGTGTGIQDRIPRYGTRQPSKQPQPRKPQPRPQRTQNQFGVNAQNYGQLIRSLRNRTRPDVMQHFPREKRG